MIYLCINEKLSPLCFCLRLAALLVVVSCSCGADWERDMYLRPPTVKDGTAAVAVAVALGRPGDWLSSCELSLSLLGAVSARVGELRDLT